MRWYFLQEDSGEYREKTQNKDRRKNLDLWPRFGCASGWLQGKNCETEKEGWTKKVGGRQGSSGREEVKLCLGGTKVRSVR